METMPLQEEDEGEGEEEEKMSAVPTEVPCVELRATKAIPGDVTPGRKIEKILTC